MTSIHVAAKSSLMLGLFTTSIMACGLVPGDSITGGQSCYRRLALISVSLTNQIGRPEDETPPVAGESGPELQVPRTESEGVDTRPPDGTQQSDTSPNVDVETRLRNLDTEVGNVRNEVSRLRSDLREATGSAAGLVLFGIVCALWAQNSGRNAWLWFFLGLFFSVITGLMMLYKNSQDRRIVSKGM